MAEAISDHDRAAGRLDPPGASPAEADAHAPERPQLGALLVGGGFISETQLEEALGEGARTGGRLGEVIVRRGWASEDDVAKLLADQWELGYVDRASIFFDAEALGRLSREEAQRLEALPTRVQDGHIVVAVAEPTEQRLAALRAVIGDDTVVVVVPKTALDAGLRSELLSGKSRDDPARDGEEHGQADQDRPAEALAAPMPPPPMPPPARADVRHEPTPAAAPAAPRPEPSATGAPAVGEPGLHGILIELEAVAGEAAALQLRVSELARRIALIGADVAAVAGRLEGAGPAEGDVARIQQLEAELAQRTEMAESLKSQLLGLNRTLESYQ